MNRRLLAVLAGLSFMCTGCATGPLGTATGSGANYRYTKDENGCQISVGSARDLIGTSVVVKDCDLQVTIKDASGDEALGIIRDLIPRTNAR